MEHIKYRYFYEADESELGTISDLFYAIKEFKLTEVSLGDDALLHIRQWKDVPMTYDTYTNSYDMHPWVVYLTDWTNIYDIWTGWWEDWLAERLEDCEKKNKWFMETERERRFMQKFHLNGREILERAHKRDDLWEYEDEYLLNWVQQWYHQWDIDDCLDEFSHFSS